MRLVRAVALAAAAVAPSAAAAHDFWIEPNAFALSVGEPLTLRLRVGEAFRGDPVPRRAAAIERFSLLGPEGEVAVPGVEGADPAGVVRPSTPGVHVIAYRGRRSAIALAPELFEGYLREEGLERVAAARRHAGTSGRPGREVFSRCAKTLVRVEPARGAGWARAAGLELEILPDADPWAAVGGTIPFRVLHRGTPLAGVQVVAMERDRPGERRLGRTDAGGRVAFHLRPGTWLLKTVHMLVAPPDTGADWESLWASLTLEIEGP